MKNKMTTITRNLFLTGMVLLASCLPQQPSAPKCPNGTEYNSTTKACGLAAASSQTQVDPTFSAATPTSNPSVTSLTATSLFSVSVYNPKNVTYSVRWFVNLAEQTAVRGQLNYTAALLAAPYSATVGSYAVVAKLVNVSTGLVYATQSWTLTITYPPTAAVTLDPSNGTTIDIIEGSAVGVTNITTGSPIPAWARAGSAISPRVSVDNGLGSDGLTGIKVEWWWDSTKLGEVCKSASGTMTLSLIEVRVACSTVAGYGAAVAATYIQYLSNRNVDETAHQLKAVTIDLYTGQTLSTAIWGANLKVKPITTLNTVLSTNTATAIDIYDGTTPGSSSWRQAATPLINPTAYVNYGLGSDALSGHTYSLYQVDGGVPSFITSINSTAASVNLQVGMLMAAYTINLADRNITETNHAIRIDVTDRYRSTLVGSFTWNLNVTPKPMTTMTATSALAFNVNDGLAASAWSGSWGPVPSFTVGSGLGSNASSGLTAEFYHGTDATGTFIGSVTVGVDATASISEIVAFLTYSYDLLAVSGSRGVAGTRNIYVRVLDTYRGAQTSQAASTYTAGSATWTATIQPKPIPQIASITTRGLDTCPATVVAHATTIYSHTNYNCTWYLTSIDSYNFGTVTTSQQWYWTNASTDPRIIGAWANNRIDVAADAPEIVLSATNNGFQGSNFGSGVTLNIYDATGLRGTYPSASNVINLYTVASTLQLVNSDASALEAVPTNAGNKFNMVLVDNYTGLEIGRAIWPLRKRQRNSPPLILIPSPVTTATLTLAQDVAQIFSGTAYDDDTDNPLIDFTYTVNAVAADGVITNYYPNANTTTPGTLPDCTVTDGGNPTCSLTFPSFDDSGPIAAPTGVVVNAYVTDEIVNGVGPLTNNTVYSPVTSWTVNVTETQTAPSVTNVILNVGGIATTTVSEGVTNATVQFDVSDAECDNFSYTVELQVNIGGSMTTVFRPFNNTVVTRTDCSPLLTTITTVNFVIPQYLNDPINQSHTAAGQALQIKVTVTDIPDTATALNNAFTATGLTAVDTNPVTAMTSGVLDPVANSTNIVQAGSMFVIDPGNLTSGNTTTDGQNAAFIASTYAQGIQATNYNTNQGNKLIYQWQVAAAVTPAADCSVSVWNNISGANLSTPAAGPVNPKLVWTPPRQNGAINYCFRLCVGDDGFNHPANCAGASTIIGPWVGNAAPGNSFTNNPPNVEKTVYTGATSNPHVASYQSTTGLTNYLAMADGTSIRVVKNVYTAATGVVTTSTNSVGSDVGQATNDTPTNISIAATGPDDTTGKLYVAYQIYDGDGYAPFSYNVIRVRCFTRGTLLQDCGRWNYNEITQKIGNISVDASNWYLPFIDIDDGYKASLIWTELSNTTTVVTIGEAANNIRERLFSTYTANSTASVQGFIDATNGRYSILVDNATTGIDLITYNTDNVVGITTNPFVEASAYVSSVQDVFPVGATRFTGVMGSTKFFLGALSSTGQFLMRNITMGAAYTVDSATYTFSGLNAHANSAINLGLYNNAAGDAAQSPVFTFGNGATGAITYYKVNYPLTSGVISTSMTASKQSINTTAGTFGGDNGKLATTLSYNLQMGVNGSVVGQNHFTNWVTYSNGVNVYQGIVNLDPFAAVAGSVTTTNTSDATTAGVGVPFW